MRFVYLAQRCGSSRLGITQPTPQMSLLHRSDVCPDFGMASSPASPASSALLHPNYFGTKVVTKDPIPGRSHSILVLSPLNHRPKVWSLVAKHNRLRISPLHLPLSLSILHSFKLRHSISSPSQHVTPLSPSPSPTRPLSATKDA